MFFNAYYGQDMLSKGQKCPVVLGPRRDKANKMLKSPAGAKNI